MKQSNQTGINDIVDTLEVGEVFGWYEDVLVVTNINGNSVFATKLKKDGTEGKLNTWWMNYKGEGYKNMVDTQSSYNRH